jgi:hypothetical protein
MNIRFLIPLLIVIVAPVVARGSVGLLITSARRGKPTAADQAGGTLRPDKVSAWVTIIVGLGIVGLGVTGVIFVPSFWPVALICILLGGALAGFMFPSIMAIHAVHWTNGYIDGPSETFGPTLGIARTRIAWPEIVRTGKTGSSYWYVEASDGRRIYWSFLHKGYGALTEAIRTHCPHLSLPADMI